MQKDQKPGTPKLNNARRPRNPGTPDNNRMRNPSADVTLPNMNRTTNLRQRGTMAPGELVIPSGLFTKRRVGNSARLNATLSQPPAQVPMRGEVESPENELGLLYDKYLQAKATEILVKKKISEKERLITIQMVAVSRERAIVEEKYEQAQARADDIRYANFMQSSIDAQNTEIANCFGELRKNKVKEKLMELKTLLEPMDELRCEGIVIPESPEEVTELLKSLEDIGEELKRIQYSVGDKGNVYKDLENGLNSLIQKHVEIESVKKKFDEVLCGLQVLVLKDASHSLSQNYLDEMN